MSMHFCYMHFRSMHSLTGRFAGLTLQVYKLCTSSVATCCLISSQTIHEFKFKFLSALVVVGGVGINMPVGWRC